jgi:hypothetical protein
MGVPNTGAPASFWEDDLGFFLAATGPTPDEQSFWTNAIGSTLGQTYMVTEAFCATGPYSYPELTPENIQSMGLGTCFHQWMQDYIYGLYCSG